MVSQRVICNRWVNSFYFHGQNICPVKHDIFCQLTWFIRMTWLLSTQVMLPVWKFSRREASYELVRWVMVSMILENILVTHFLMLSIISIYLSCQESSGIIWFCCLNFPHCTVVDSDWFRRSLGWKSSCLARHDAAKTATLRRFWCRVPLHYNTSCFWLALGMFDHIAKAKSRDSLCLPETWNLKLSRRVLDNFLILK